MPVDENKALVRRSSEELWSKGNVAVIDELFATNYVLHAPPPGVTPDREGYKQFVRMHHVVFPDFRNTVEDVIAEGDKVALRWTWSGTHKGEYMGIASTGKQVTVAGISILRIEGGKIVEEWDEVDMLGLMQQLGVVPPPGQGGG